MCHLGLTASTGDKPGVELHGPPACQVLSNGCCDARLTCLYNIRTEVRKYLLCLCVNVDVT